MKSNRAERMLAAMAAAIIIVSMAISANAADPLKIGFGMALTGPLAGNGKAALIAIEMWANDINKKGGLLGRPVQLVYYDDQSNPALVPGLYSKLLDIDQVDLVVSGYGTNLEAPAMPIIMQRGLVFMGLFGLAVNEQFHYDRVFQIGPAGPDPKLAFSEGYFEAAMTINPKPETIAITGADAEYSKLTLEGVRDHAKKLGLKIVYDRTYPPTTTDYTPIVRSIKATEPDLVFVASYPIDTAGILNAVSELRLTTKMFGGGMVGLQYASFKQQFGAKLNGIIYYNFWAPEPTMKFPGIDEFLQRYQSSAAAKGADALGFYLPPYAYAAMQILGEAVETTKGLDQKAIADYIHKTTFRTIMGNISFGPEGEWTKSRVIYTQARGIVGNDLEQFKQAGREVIVWPPEFKTGNLQYPYAQ
jgi:branched-chain amino acid transport system substrate-binding protein